MRDADAMRWKFQRDAARAARRAPAVSARAANDETPIVREGITADEVAVLLGCDRKTVYDYAGRGKIPHRRLGRRLVFSRSAVLDWLACKSASGG